MSKSSSTTPSSKKDYRALMTKALIELKKTKNKLRTLEGAKSEPIAIIGMGCRFPGGAETPASFWQLLNQGVDAIGEVPASRWDIDAYYDPEPGTPGKMYTRHGGFLSQVDGFDAQFFGISPREATSLDPQQRLLLEVSWEALEDAHLVPSQLSETASGVFLGVCLNDYSRLLSAEPERIDAYVGTGTSPSAVAGRLSYFLGLQGPSLVVDTACSSSLVSVHLACQSLRAKECDLALAGGVNLLLSPEGTINFCQARMMAPDGRCKTFDASADGYTRGEGCGMIVLKRLSDAIDDGDTILALIRGAAVNHDGPSGGLTVPNGLSQQAVIRHALKNAHVKAAEVSYIESHGTGTSLGDPIEIEALGAVYGQKREQPLIVGSVKTNIGHLEGAAGIAGIIKVVLSLQNHAIPAHLNFSEPNPHIPWHELAVNVPTEPQSWPEIEGKRIAGVSSFGFSGTNAHLVLEAAPAPVREAEKSNNGEAGAIAAERPYHLLTLSAKTEAALNALAESYSQYLSTSPAWADVCFTANTRREHFSHRLTLVANSSQKAHQELAAFVADSKSAISVVTGQAASKAPKIAFLFTGQGSQYVEMGRGLYESEPTFRFWFEHCNKLYQAQRRQRTGGNVGPSLLEVLYGNRADGASLLDETAYTQPALFALEYALAQLWKSWGIEPDYVCGHSVGEYVAACVAGVFSLEDGLKLISERGRLMQRTERGEMVAILASESQIQAALHNYDVSLAAINTLPWLTAQPDGPLGVVISGQSQAIQAMIEELQRQGVKTKRLSVKQAFHSSLMDPILLPFKRVAQQVSYASPRLSLVSNLSGDIATDEIATAEYWCDHIRQPVRFATSMERLYEQGVELFVEIGPKPVLLGMGRRCLPDKYGRWLPSLRPAGADWQQMLYSLGELYVRGVQVEWAGFYGDVALPRVVLPTYPWQRRRYWVEPKQEKRPRHAGMAMHPLLGQRLHVAGSKEIRFESQISLNEPRLAYLSDHCIFELPILPATAYLEMANAAGAEQFKTDDLALENVLIHQALRLPPTGEATTLQLILTSSGTDKYAFQISSLASQGEAEATSPSWTVHSSGQLKRATGDAKEQLASTHQADLPTLQAQHNEEVDVEAYYQRCHAQGLNYGPRFQGIEALFRDGMESALGLIRLPKGLSSSSKVHKLHPVLLDACFQLLGVLFSDEKLSDIFVPVGVERLQVYAPPSREVWSHAQLRPVGSNEELLNADFRLFGPDGDVIALVTGLQLKKVSRDSLLGTTQALSASEPALPTRPPWDAWFYEIAWQTQALTRHAGVASQEARKNPGSWLIFADEYGLGDALERALQQRGHSCLKVRHDNAQRTSQEVVTAFQQALQTVETPCQGIVYLWGLDIPQLSAQTSAPLTDTQQLGSVGLMYLVQSLARLGWRDKPRLWVVTGRTQVVTGAEVSLSVAQAPLWGLGRVLAHEHPELKCSLVDLNGVPASTETDSLLAELLADSTEDQVAFRDGTRYVARLIKQKSDSSTTHPLLSANGRPYRLSSSQLGVLDKLHFQMAMRQPPQPDEVEIEVRAAGLNFLDVLAAMGIRPDMPEGALRFGGECTGIISAIGSEVTELAIGDEVLAIAEGSFGSHVTAPAAYVVPKPSNLSFAEAATIPIGFMTAHYALQELARLRAGERVLIHSATGGTGLAAVKIAQVVGAELFATAGNEEKRDYLRSLGIRHVYDSRVLAFADEIMATTNDQGVDVILNSLVGEAITKGLEILAPYGRFLEIGKRDIYGNSQIGLWPFQKNLSYFGIDLARMSTERRDLFRSLLQNVVQHFADGTLQPPPLRIFPMSQAAEAFRYMAQAKHIGKIILSVEDEAGGLRSEEKEEVPLASALPEELLFRPNATYVITGGLGGLGLTMARYLIEKGARHLVLMSRRVPSQAVQAEISQLEQESGAELLVMQGDVTKRDDLKRILAQIEQNGQPLRGLIHAAGILDDGILLQLNAERFQTVMAPKVDGAWNLHLLTADKPLDFFVLFSSVASVVGSPGQANYSAANAFLDALAHHRRAQGQVALSINWGPWSEVGLVAQKQAGESVGGIRAISPEQGVAIFDHLLRQNASQVGVMSLNLRQWQQLYPAVSRSPLLSDLVTQEQDSSPAAHDTHWHDILQAADSSYERRRLLEKHLRTQITHVLRLEPEQIDNHTPLGSLGFDSLMALELRNRLEDDFGLSLSATLIWNYQTIADLTPHLAEKMGFPLESAPEPLATPEASAESLASLLSEEESEAFASLLNEMDDLSLDELQDALA